MLGDIRPFRIIGNTYFVGTEPASSHLIDTGEGLILIDTGYAHTADVVVESMEELGFDVRDVKYIIHSHGHYDHTGGTEKIVALSGAKTFLAKEDYKYIVGFDPDYDMKDGDIIKLGKTEILCLRTPGHTEGTVSLFWNEEEAGKVYRLGTFGGAGTAQVRKDFLDQCNCSYLNRGMFFESLSRLKKEHVDVFIGNHAPQNSTRENSEIMRETGVNPFIDDTKWLEFLEKVEASLESKFIKDSREYFINYAHRGASEYAPENTFTAFHMGASMGANGLETDVQMTKDGVLVLFHDETLERLTGAKGKVSDYTIEELKKFTLEKNGYTGKIALLEELLKEFCMRTLTLAIEIKQAGIEEKVVDMIYKYDCNKKVVVTSFMLDSIKKVKEYAPNLRVGYLVKGVDDTILKTLREAMVDELCPYAEEVTPESVHKWHRLGFNVRAWGVKNEEQMRNVYESMADGMTINFPDKLANFVKNHQ